MGFTYRRIFMSNIKVEAIRIGEKLKQAWDENPVAAMTAVSLVLGGTARLISSITSYKNSRSWDREVERRRNKDRSRYSRV
jgi:uncharacterized protein YdeI (YjbR/CyaY-like superfamily)